MYYTKNWRISDDDLSDHRRIFFECTIGVEHDLVDRGRPCLL